MHRPVVLDRRVNSRIMRVAQAPGDKEPKWGRPFAGTAGITLLKWFDAAVGWTEEEIARCARWLAAEVALLCPALLLPVGKLAIAQFMPPAPLVDLIGQSRRIDYHGHAMDCIALASDGASKTLLHQALSAFAAHPAVISAN